MLFKKSVLAVIAAVLFSIPSVFAQGTQQMPQQGQQEVDIDVSDKEMERFVKVSDELQVVQQDAQEKMMNAIEENGLDVQRYSEIEQANRSGQEVDMTDKEKAAYDKTSEVVQAEQMKIQEEAQKLLEKHDFKEQRYMKISQALRSDQELMQKYREIKEGN